MSFNDFLQYASINDQSLSVNINDFIVRPDVQETKGLKRLRLVCENFRNLTFEQAYHVIGTDAFQDEFEETQSYKIFISTLHILRVLFSLAPLILTWYALSTAASSYQLDLKNIPDDRTDYTFLQLWQSGFHNPHGLTFSTTAIWDVVLLLLLLLTNLGIVWLESQARKKARLFAQDLHKVTDGVLRAVSIAGISQITNDADIDKIVKAVRTALDSAFKDIDLTMQNVGTTITNVNTGIVQANQAIESLFINQVNPIFQQFSRDMGTFQQNIADLRKDFSAVSISSASIAKSTTEIGNSATQLAQDAQNLDGTVKQINTHLSTLNTTEASMITKIEATQLAVATEVKKGQMAMVVEVNKTQQISIAETSKVVASMNATVNNVSIALDQMKQAAQSVTQVTQTVSGINPNTVSKISANMLQLNKDTTDLSRELQATINELKKLNFSTANSQQTQMDRALLLAIVDELKKVNTRKRGFFF